MSTRANVVVQYWDRKITAPSALWLYHHDGNVQGIGETIVRTVCACRLYVEDGNGLGRLWDMFTQEFENVTDISPDIEFLYRITYKDNKVTMVVRHGGYIGERAEQHYRHANDTADNSVELLCMEFEGNVIASWRHDVREPESYIRTLSSAMQPAARAWRGEAGRRRGERA